MGHISKAKGNMYNWVSCVWNIGRGCSHQCLYCYVKNFGGNPATFRLESLAGANLYKFGPRQSIFVGHMCDMFSDAVSDNEIYQVLEHCRKYPLNQYVFQTKNPERVLDFYNYLPEHRLIGTTIETDNAGLLKSYSEAPPPQERARAIGAISALGGKTFITIEPIMRFDLGEMIHLMTVAHPSFINIGADSKNNRLPEPGPDDIKKLKELLIDLGHTIKEKHNLTRIENENN